MHFSKHYRLLNKVDFKNVFDKSNKVSQKYLLALFKTNQLSHARIGIIVGKRVANKAVTRNQIKRVLRESFRHHQDHLKGLDIIVIARQQCDTLDKTNLRRGIDRLWEKLQEDSKKLLFSL